jgi:hypothetical protein
MRQDAVPWKSHSVASDFDRGPTISNRGQTACRFALPYSTLGVRTRGTNLQSPDPSEFGRNAVLVNCDLDVGQISGAVSAVLRSEKFSCADAVGAGSVDGRLALRL